MSDIREGDILEATMTTTNSGGQTTYFEMVRGPAVFAEVTSGGHTERRGPWIGDCRAPVADMIEEGFTIVNHGTLTWVLEDGSRHTEWVDGTGHWEAAYLVSP